MLDDRMGDEQRKLAVLNQLRQQESVLSPDRAGVEHSRVNIHLSPSYRESSGVQIAEATIRLQQMVLKSYESQCLYSPH